MRGWWKDTGRLDDMLEANRLILDTIERARRGRARSTRQVDGRVVIEAGARLERSTVRGPAIIGAGARLIDCYIGPYTAIGERLRRSSAPRSSTRSCSRARRVRDLDGRMESSLLGPQRRRSAAATRQPRAYRFMVGDNSEIGIL